MQEYFVFKENISKARKKRKHGNVDQLAHLHDIKSITKCVDKAGNQLMIILMRGEKSSIQDF